MLAGANTYEESVAMDSVAAVDYSPTFDPDGTLHVGLVRISIVSNSFFLPGRREQSPGLRGRVAHRL
jgi:hypothetical protein